MNHMPNPDAPDCGCQWLEQAAKDESIPVVFDKLMNEYHLVYSDHRGHLLLYHCPFCGGKAPKSLRGTYWAEVSLDESYRLQSLTKEIKTSQGLFALLGRPDHDFEVGSSYTSPGSEKEPPETTLGSRRVVFKSLSDTVDVHVTIDRYDRLNFSFQGRYIGPKQN